MDYGYKGVIPMLIFLLIFTIMQLMFILALFLLARAKYKILIQDYGVTFQFNFMAPSTLYLIDKLSLIERFPKTITYIHHKIIKIYGTNNAAIYTKLFVSQLISAILIFLLFFSLLGLINKDLVFFYFGFIFVAIITILLIKDLDKKIRKKQEQIIIELPEFINKVTLLVNAGETIQQAIIRSVEQKKDHDKSYLYKELLYSTNQIRNNYPFNHVLDELSKRCSMQEISIFTTTVLLNYRRGGNDFVTALNRLSQELWQKRISLSRTLGEQASSKLVFPMVLIFIVVLIIIATPAIMLF